MRRSTRGCAEASKVLEAGRELLREGLRHRSFLIGGLLTLAFLAMAVLSLVWTPYGVAEIGR